MEFEIVVSLIQEADASEIVIRKRSDNTMSKKKVDKRTNNDLHEPTNNRGDLMWSERLSSSYSTSETVM